MRFIGGLLIVILLIAGVAIATGFVDLQKTRDGQLPEIAVKEGTLPEYEASVAKVDVGTRNETVEVPTVAVRKP